MKMIMTPFIWIYITPILLISPFLTISLNSWFSIWISLELNLMAFIPFIIFSNKFNKELSIKYFIIQSFSSTLLIFTSNFLYMYNNNYMNFSFSYYMNLILNISLLIKMGATPFHTWFINMMNNLNWISCLILSTYQKISPMILLFYTFNKNLIYWVILFCSIYSAIFGNNHQSIRLIMAFSSINHISWMLMNLMINEMLWMFYFLCYFFINCSIMLILNKFKIFFINELYFLTNSNMTKFILLLNIFSISGLPPFMGFMMKWFSIYFINMNNSFILMLIMILMSMLTFTFYTRLAISFLVLMKLENKMKLLNKFNLKINLLKFLFLTTFMYLWMMNIWLI